MDLCLAVEHKPVLHLSRQWWEHPARYILRIREGSAASEVRGAVMEEFEGEIEG